MELGHQWQFVDLCNPLATVRRDTPEICALSTSQAAGGTPFTFTMTFPCFAPESPDAPLE